MTSGERRRFPRRLVKGGLWLLAVLAVLLVAVFFVARSEWTRLRVLRLAEARLEETLGRDVRIGELEYSLRGFYVVARDVVIPGSRPEGPPFARVPEVRVELAYEGWFQPTLTVERVVLLRPEVWMVFYEDGTTNLPDIRTGEGGGRLEVVMGRLLVDDGVVHFDDRDLPLSFEAAPVQATFEGPAARALPEDHLVGRLIAQELRVVLPEARPWRGGLSARAEISPGRVHVTAGRLSGRDLRARFEAVYHWSEEARGGEVEIEAEGDAELANRLGYLEEAIEGPFHVRAEVDLEEGATTYHGTVTSRQLRFGGRVFGDVEARLSGGSGGLVVDVLEAAHAGGTLAGTVTVPAETDPAGLDTDVDQGQPVRVEAEGRGLELARLIDDLELEGSPLAGLHGRAGVDFIYDFSTAAPLAGDGEGTVRLAGVERRGEEGLPLSGTVPLAVDDGVLTVEGARLDAPGQVLTASGRYDLEAESGRFDYRLTSERVGRLARALPLPPELTVEGPPRWLPTGGTGTVEGVVVLRPGGGYRVEATAELAAVETPALSFDRIRAPLVFEDGVLSGDGVVLEGRGQRLMLTGSYDLEAETADADFRLSSGDLRTLADMATALGGEDAAPPAWFPTSGSGSVEGELALAAGGALTGHAEVELEDVTVPAAGDAPPLVLDRLAGAFRLTPEALRDLRLEATTDGGALVAAGSVPLPALGEPGGAARVGSAGWRREPFDLTLDAVDWPLATLLAFVPDAPAVTGTLSGEVTVEGTVEAPRGRGDLALAGATVPPPGGGPPVALDRVAASFRLTPGAVRDLRLEAATADGTLLVTGSAPLPPIGGGDASAGVELGTPGWRREPFDLVLRAVDWPLEPVLAFVPNAPVVRGVVDGEAALEGTWEAPRGRARLAVAPLVVAGHELDRVTADLSLTGSRLRVDSLRAAAPAGEVVAFGTWDRESGALAGRVAASDLALSEAPLGSLVPGDLEGRLDLVADVGGTLAAPRVRLESTASGLAVQGQPIGDGGTSSMLAVWSDDRVRARGSLLGLLDFDGGGRLTVEDADLALEVAVDDLESVLRLFAGSPLEGLEGSLAGTLEVSGRFDAPRGADVTLRLDPVRLAYEGRVVENLEPVVLVYRPDLLIIDTLFLGEPAAQGDGEIFVTGSIGLGGADGEDGEAAFPLDLRAQAELDARWLELALPDFDLEGRIQALTTIGGTLSEPLLSGQAAVDGGQVLIPDFPHAIEDLDAVALLYPDRVVLDTATARLGGGRLRAAGSLGLTELAAGDASYRFQVQVDDASVRYPEGFLLRGDANLALVSSPDGRLISGVVELERAFYLSDVPAGFSQLLGEVFQPSRLEAGSADPRLADTELNVSVEGEDALRVRNNVADLSGDIELVVRGNLASPTLFGQVVVDEGGDIVYAENEYTVSRGLLTFANPYEIDPVIDFVATTEVRNYDIILNLAGTLDRLDVSFTSDPPLADLEVVSLLTVGRPIGEGALVTGDPAAGDPAAGGVDQAAQQLLYGQAASLVSERVNTLFGFDRFRVSPATGTAGTGSLAVTVGQQISRDVYVTYSRDPSVPEVDILQVEWQVYDNVVVVLTSKGDQTYALDVQIERKF